MIKRIDRKLIHEGSCLRLYSDTMQTPTGYTEEWDMVEHRFNAAAILPVTPEGNVLLVNQYRSTCDRMTWEIPAGKKDDDGAEDSLLCAIRELKEETGYTSDDIRPYMTVRPAIAYSTEVIDVYVALNVYRCGEQELDEAEFINVKEWDVSTLKKMIREGQIEDSKTIIAILSMDGYFEDLSRD